jgi:peptidoglycan/xylan/chitin deacetylase (PgdA/CDA1 family)
MNKCIRSWIRASGLVLFASTIQAGPVTTVPWNGHPGAVSFTFDDGCQSQLDHIIQPLKDRKINATFFLYNAGNAFTGNQAAWVAVAKDGNELGNHTLDHADLNNSATNGTAEVTGMATLLRNADPSIQAVTLAYPGCSVGSASAVGAESFIARSCMFGGGPFTPMAWKDQPSNWLNVPAIYMADSTLAKAAMASMDAAKSGGGWIPTLDHGVSGDWLSLPTDSITKMFDHAISDGLWIGTFQDVGAYWRASFTMDNVSVSGSSPWTLTWTSPHPKMPKSVKLKVKLDAATFGNTITVSQDNAMIPANSDGSYTIDFMKLKLTVTKGSTGIGDPIIYGRVRATVSGATLVFSGLTAGNYSLSLRSISGTLLGRTPLNATSDEERMALPSGARGRILAILDAPGKETRVFPLMVP